MSADILAHALALAWLLWLVFMPRALPPRARPRRLTRNERRRLGLTEGGYLARWPGWWQGFRATRPAGQEQ